MVMAGQSQSKIKKYHRELSTMTRPPHFIFRPRKKEHLKIALKKAGFDPSIKQIKAVPIWSTEKHPLRWFDSKGRFILQEQYVKTAVVHVDPMAVSKDPKAYARKIIRENPDAEIFQIKVGEHYLSASFTKRTFTQGFVRLINRYKGERKKNFVNNVLSGFDLNFTREQATYAEWQASQKRIPKKAGRKPKKKNA